MSILNQEHTRLMESVKELLKNSLSKKSIVLDIWTTPGMKESYIGGNAYFVDADFKIRKLFLGLVEMPVGHNAIVVREHAGKLLTNLGIQESDVFVVITDNASNFKRAYSEALNEKNLVDAESDELDEDHENNEEVEEVESNDEDDEVESNDEDEINDDEVQNELQEVEALETEYNGIYPTRLSCAAHDLSLVMSTVFEKKSILSSSIIKMTKKLISRFKKSHAATKSLAIKTKEVLSKSLVLLLPGPTRWAGHFYMINRLLKIVNPINEIALTKGWEILEERHLKVLRGLHALMKPVADLLLQSQSEEMGISKLYFALMEMIDTLENLELEDLTLTSTKSDLQAEIKRRFARILDPDSNEFNSLYIKASILDPQEFLTLEEEKYSIDDYLREMIKESMRLECEKNPSQASDTSNTQDQSSQKSYKDRLIAKRRENLSRCNQNANQEEPIQAIIKEYKRMMESPHVQNLTPLEFWQQHGNGILAPLKQNALDLLPVPMTGASIERVFSSASLATKGIKNRSSSNLLRKKLFIHLNN
uniref:HAT C-terminal dimerisation domain-containing protein n=1 Tax=Acrobeloides nanus TaxID=290746 RepID=A0A914CBN3_9BILA